MPHMSAGWQTCPNATEPPPVGGRGGEALVLLTALAHNLLAWPRGWIFRDSPFADAGICRMVKELFPILVK